MNEVKNHLVNYGFLWGPEHNPYGVSGFMTYGPMGVLLKEKIEQEFARVFEHEGFDRIETPVLFPKAALEASGHVAEFRDELFYTNTSDGRELVGRPEMATTIYPMFKRLLAFYQGKLPFRIYQRGLVLPNDRQTTWQTRTRQYTGHEGHLFLDKKGLDYPKTIDYLEGLGRILMMASGINQEDIAFLEKTDGNKPFYATKAYGMYVKDDGLEKELEVLGIQYRSERDIRLHSQATGIKLVTGDNYPEVFEISFSSDRPFFLVLSKALRKNDERTVLALPYQLSPIQVMALTTKSDQASERLARDLSDQYDKFGIRLPVIAKHGIGKGHHYADAIGVPYVFTMDHHESAPFKLRDRDSGVQIRLSIDNIVNTLREATIRTPLYEVHRRMFEASQNLN